ncbi:hypothetical protein MTR_8g087500 [Medicago truncatula]|uniref:Uncharacterized protein n=1 Tax=Medicago truncatula TaxID=3880 RepID=G7L796_MEDTR|nr:hypothetical protein MTR_8g087500 [Medicago truncatula]
MTTEEAKAGKMNHNHKPLFEANNKEKGVDGATRAESEEAIHIKVEDPQVAPKSPVLSRVPSSPLENTELAPLCLCPRGRW